MAESPGWLRQAMRIESAVDRQDLEALHQYAAQAREEELGVIVEIGSYRGRSAVALAQGGKIFCVDRWAPFTALNGATVHLDLDTFVGNMERVGLRDRIVVLRDESSLVGRAWQRDAGPKVGLLFIDGDHRKAGVTRDWSAWMPNLGPGALVLWHDMNLAPAGVQAQVTGLVSLGVLELIEIIPSTYGLAVTRYLG